MSAVTKKHHINMELKLDNRVYSFKHVPNKLIESVIESLREFQDDQDVVSWRETEILKEDLASIGGIPAYRESAMMLKAARLKSGLSQVQLAQKLGTKQNNVSMMENAKRAIGKRTAMKLGKIFNTGYKVFLSELVS